MTNSNKYLFLYSGGLASYVLYQYLLRRNKAIEFDVITFITGTRANKIELGLIEKQRLPYFKGAIQLATKQTKNKEYLKNPKKLETEIKNELTQYIIYGHTLAQAQGYKGIITGYYKYTYDHPEFKNLEIVGRDSNLYAYLNLLVLNHSGGSNELISPFASMTLPEILAQGRDVGVNYLNHTFSCIAPVREGGNTIHCGTCHKCLNRKNSIALTHRISENVRYKK